MVLASEVESGLGFVLLKETLGSCGGNLGVKCMPWPAFFCRIPWLLWDLVQSHPGSQVSRPGGLLLFFCDC